MADDSESPTDSPVAELREITLLIPGEHFFCETLPLPEDLDPEEFEDFAVQALNFDSFSPFPADQLAWGFHACSDSAKVFVFATPFVKLRQLGWQNLEYFRRVLPSFTSLMAKGYAKSTIAFLLHDETLTAASFEPGTTVPDALYSLPVDLAEKDDFEAVRGKLLSMFDLACFEEVQEVLVAGDVSRTNNGFFRFENEWLSEDNTELADAVEIPADDLWTFDLRPEEFKLDEQKRRKLSALRWKGVMASIVGMAALFLLFIGLQIASVKVDELWVDERLKDERKPDVLAAMDLLKRLEENKRGGIDPINALARIMQHRAIDPRGNATLYLTFAEFKSRYALRLKGNGSDAGAFTDFLTSLEQAEVIRENPKVIKSNTNTKGPGWVFDVDVQMLDEKPLGPASAETSFREGKQKIEG